ncbi:hypothetical protein KKC52_01715, partial [bacterium]|nr:hypothetical protein [bacterium]
QEAEKCARKWVFGQKGIDQTCCPECQYFHECLAGNRQRRWQLVHDFIGPKNSCEEPGKSHLT